MNSNDLQIKDYLLKGGLWAFSGKTTAALLGVAFYGLLARMLDADGFGVFILATNMATFFAIIASFGVENTVLRLISTLRSEGSEKNSGSLIIKSSGLILVTATVVGLVYFLFMGDIFAVYVFESETLAITAGSVSIWIVLLAYQRMAAEAFRAYQDVRSAMLSGGLITTCLSLVFVSFYYLFNNKIELVVVIQLVLTAISLNLLWASLNLKKRMGEYRLTEDSKFSFRDIASHSWPLMANNVIMFVSSWSALWVLAAFRPEKEVAVFGAAMRLVLLTNYSLQIVNSVVPPLITRHNLDGANVKLEKILRYTASMAAVPSLAALIVFAVFGESVLLLVYGEGYRNGWLILVILSFGYLINVLTGSCGYVLMMLGHRFAVTFASLLAVAISVSISFLLVEQHGVMGVAIAASAALIVQNLFLLMLSRYKCGIWTIADFRNMSWGAVMRSS